MGWIAAAPHDADCRPQTAENAHSQMQTTTAEAGRQVLQGCIPSLAFDKKRTAEWDVLLRRTRGDGLGSFGVSKSRTLRSLQCFR